MLMLKRILISILVITITANGISAQTFSSVYKKRIEIIHTNIYKYFYDSANALYYETNNVQPNEKKHSYLWPLCALLQAANEAEKINLTKY